MGQTYGSIAILLSNGENKYNKNANLHVELAIATCTLINS